MSLRIAIIGGGNVATHFFKSLGERSVQKIFVRKKEENSHLPLALLSESKDLRTLDLAIIIIAVSDDQIINVMTNYHFDPDQIILHTAGSVDYGCNPSKARKMWRTLSVNDAFQRRHY